MIFSLKVLSSLLLPAVLLGGMQPGFTRTGSWWPLYKRHYPESVQNQDFRLNVEQGVSTMEAAPAGAWMVNSANQTHGVIDRPIACCATLSISGPELVEKQAISEYDRRGFEILAGPVAS